jgi:hypothetical protein
VAHVERIIDDALPGGGHRLHFHQNAIEQVARMSAAICGDKPQPRMSLRSSGLRLLVEIGFLRGTKGSNCYGPDPLFAA